MADKYLIKIFNEYTVDEILDMMNVEKNEALEALIEIGLIDLERFEQYFNEREEDD